MQCHPVSPWLAPLTAAAYYCHSPHVMSTHASYPNTHIHTPRTACAAGTGALPCSLDVDTLRCLEEAVSNFAGTVLIVSHDRWFLDRVATHILAFEGDSRVTLFTGSYSQYEAHRKATTGAALLPTRVKFRKLATAV